MPSAKQLVKQTLNISASLLGAHNRPSNTPRLWILMYHRILPTHDRRFVLEEPGMIVTPETLDMHIQEARKLFTIISLSEWVERYNKNMPLPKKACTFTFDDGWADNIEFAEPILQKYDIPATLFAVADKISTNFRFWPNIVAELMFIKYPALGQHPMFTEAHQYSDQPFSKEATAKVISNLKQHSDESIFTALEEINWQDALSNTEIALMNWRELIESNLVIGSHTSTHRRLTQWLNRDALHYEIAISKETILKKSGYTPQLFCYPNGDYCKEALEQAKIHYSAAVTTQKGINNSKDLNIHELKRIPLHDDISNTPTLFRARLAAW